MSHEVYQKLIHIITQSAEPFSLQNHNYNKLLNKIDDARFVLIGEATHGSEEFYQTRIDITKQLIEKKNFMAVAIEGDWPDVYQIHRYLQGMGDKATPESALIPFRRFPTWMWRNTTIPPFLRWLRTNNDHLPPSQKVGFYGLDLYSLDTSINAVIDYLSKVDPEAAMRARLRYGCFDHLKVDPKSYGYLINTGEKKSCMKAVIEQLLELQHHAFDYVKKDGIAALDEYFYAMQNARLVKNAEHYYRTMFEGHVSSWNVRDQHMTETLNLLADHLENRFQRPAKIIVWAHNSHVGNAQATEMRDQGEVNIGQLIREEHSTDVYSIGFSTYEGTVLAASEWDGPAKSKKILPGIEGSYEALFHQVAHKNFILDLHQKELEHYLQLPRLQRAIGVIYKPETERMSHYFFSQLPYQFDTMIHIDKTSALKSLN